MVGLARGQTARLNVVYLPPVDPDRPACSSDHFIATVEVFGPNVATSLLYPGPAFVPPIDPDMPAPR
jgi:hypothetical protein